MPGAHGVRCHGVAHEHRVYAVSEKLLHEQRGVLIRADEIGERSENRAVAERLALTKQARCGGRQPPAIPLELLERTHAPPERSPRLGPAEPGGARERFPLS